MAEAVAEDATVQAAVAAAEFSDLGPGVDTPSPEAPRKGSWEPLARPLAEVLANPTQTRWLLRDELELAMAQCGASVLREIGIELLHRPQPASQCGLGSRLHPRWRERLVPGG